jgi:hypothetical protein
MDRPNDIWFADEPEVQQDLRLSGEHFLGRLDGENSCGEPVPEDELLNLAWRVPGHEVGDLHLEVRQGLPHLPDTSGADR